MSATTETLDTTATSDPNAIRDAAIELGEKYGFRIVPLKERDKRPLLERWQRISSTQKAMVKLWWKDNPRANVGVQLGPRSELVDVECDSPEAETAYLELFDGNAPVVPTFMAKRGKHRLFRWSIGMPAQAVVKYEGIEFRLGGGDKGAQSVFPPSIHPSGEVYRWLVSMEDAPLIALPASVVDRLCVGKRPLLEKDKRGDSDAEVFDPLANVVEPGRNNACAKMAGVLLKRVFDLADSREIEIALDNLLNWNDARCKPPLSKSEAKPTFHSILKSEREERSSTLEKKYPVDCGPTPEAPDAATENSAVVGDTVAGETPGESENSLSSDESTRGPAGKTAVPPARKSKGSKSTKKRGAKAWKLEIVKSQPRRYRLYSPKYEGFVEISNASHLRQAGRILNLILDQKDCLLEDDFIADWKGNKKTEGLLALLMKKPSFVEPSVEGNREAVVAKAIFDRLNEAVTIGDGDAFSSVGKPQRAQDGDVVFKFEYLASELAINISPKVEWDEIVATLEAARIHGGHRVKIDGTYPRRHRASAEGMAALALKANGGRPLPNAQP